MLLLIETDSVLRERLDRSRREAEYSKKKLQQQHQEEIEEFESNKKTLEKRVSCYIRVAC